MLREYRESIVFLVKYVVLYVLLNTLYGLYIQHYRPEPDPVTILVTRHTASFLSLFDDDISSAVVDKSANVPILKAARVVVEVYEGCNSINVMIVYVAFLVAFRGPLNAFLVYLGGGLFLVYVINILRVSALYSVALHFPDQLYFFHKFFFTGMIYAVVFLLWFLWVRQVKAWKAEANST